MFKNQSSLDQRNSDEKSINNLVSQLVALPVIVTVILGGLHLGGIVDVIAEFSKLVG